MPNKLSESHSMTCCDFISIKSNFSLPHYFRNKTPENHSLAGRMWTRQGCDCRPTALLAQQASVTISESVCGRKVTVLTWPFVTILEFSTCMRVYDETAGKRREEDREGLLFD